MAETYWDLFFGYTVLWVMVFFLFLQLTFWQRKLQRKLDSINTETTRN